MPKIKSIHAREILDSRGNPTLEVEVTLENGIKAKAAVPSGASTGKFEALELRDNDPKRYGGKGVLKAIDNVNFIIGKKLQGFEVEDQKKIDQTMIELDGTENKSKLGANAILGVSLACAKVAAKAQNLELYKYIAQLFGLQTSNFVLPVAMMNIVNGGKHADSGLDIQEYMIVPQAKEFKEKLRIGSEVFQTLKGLLKQDGYQTGVGDEGGFAPKLQTNLQPLEFIAKATEKAGYTLGKDVCLAIDAAASSFYNEKESRYVLSLEHASLTSEQLVALYLDWANKFPIISIEDGLAEEDWEGWKKLSQKSKVKSQKLLIVGDDLLVTNVKRLERAIKEKACNAILIKPNQIGTLTETLDCMKRAKEAGFETIISHRSGETCDTFIADLAVGTNAGFIKSGSLSRGERVSKYNRLMEIEEQIK